MTTIIKGTIHGLGKRYADGTEPMEIWVPSDRANGLPYSNGQRVPVSLKISGDFYHAGLRATVKNAYVWISPDVINGAGLPEKLAHVLARAGFKKNDKVFLCIEGTDIALKAASSF